MSKRDDHVDGGEVVPSGVLSYTTPCPPLSVETPLGV
jgi:hypothetical protein